jgi:eukaryotic-like serine/threonine-protein kinase
MVDPLITTIDDRYQILRVIGTGGMGTVYEAKHKVIGKRVAVKVLHAQLIHDTDATSRFLDEARAVASIGHANIVDCSDVGVMSNGAPFIVLEYLEGITLHDEIEMKILSVRRALRVIGQIASGLEAAHVQGVIHRDLKSENIFLVSRGDNPDHVKILDFGVSKFIAKPAERATRRGLIIGTPDFMAPEQLSNPDSVDHRIDVYAIGCILYHCLSGKYPFGPIDLPTLVHRIVNEPPPKVERADVPIQVNELIGHLMAKDPAKRPQNMAAVVELVNEIRSKSSTLNTRMTTAVLEAAAPGDIDGPALPNAVTAILPSSHVTASLAAGPAVTPSSTQNPVSTAATTPAPSGGQIAGCSGGCCSGKADAIDNLHAHCFCRCCHQK